MLISKLAKNGQIVIPITIRTKHGFVKGDIFKISMRDDRIILTPLYIRKKNAKN